MQKCSGGVPSGELQEFGRQNGHSRSAAGLCSNRGESVKKRWTAFRLEDTWTFGANIDEIGIVGDGGSKGPTHYVTEEESDELLGGDAAKAEARAREALAADPKDSQARTLLGAALRQQRRYEEARAALEPVVAATPHMELAVREYGLALAGLGRREDGIDMLLRAIDLKPFDRSAWYWLGDLLAETAPGDDQESRSPPPDDRLTEARAAYRDGNMKEAATILRRLLEESPDHVEGVKLRGEVLVRLGHWREAKEMLERSVELAPSSVAARFRLASMLLTHAQFGLALIQIEELMKRDPANRIYRMMKPLCLARVGDPEAAIQAFERFLADYPDRPGLWVEYARLLKTEQSLDMLNALKKATEIMPTLVNAYLTAAFTKSIKLGEAFVSQVRPVLAREGLSHEDRARLHFALGRVFEDMKCYADSFEHYRLSNEILCTSRDFGPERSLEFTHRTKRFYKQRFFHARSGWGCRAPDPIFILGMPRAGSTLVEQILSSHSRIEGLGELRDLSDITRKLMEEAKRENLPPYPIVVREFDVDRVRALGEEYLEKTRGRRKTDRPYFTDKMPGNHVHVAFIHLILPNAKIIDARRHPLDCCFSCFKHYFPAGQPLSTNLRDVGHAYVDYVEQMAFFDELLPGRVHRVIYEKLVDDPETEVRRMLDYVGLPFEEQCLRFHENKRLVRTISQDQVRMPLYKTGKEQWLNYEPWLGPLKEELGYVLDCYPEVPKYFTEIHARWNQPLALGQGANPFGTVKGVGQIPFEIAA
jgi:tetratricopeptide (TPR) repeat protein